MAVRTGTQLKDTDMAAVESALTTLVTTPTQGNYDALLAALDTVTVNARESRGITATAGNRRVHNDIYVTARSIKKDALHIAQKHGVTNSTLWAKLKRTHVTGKGTPWISYRNEPTTD